MCAERFCCIQQSVEEKGGTSVSYEIVKNADLSTYENILFPNFFLTNAVFKEFLVIQNNIIYAFFLPSTLTWHFLFLLILSIHSFTVRTEKAFGLFVGVYIRLLRKSSGKNRRLQWSETKISLLESFFYDMTTTQTFSLADDFPSLLIRGKMRNLICAKRWRWIMMKRHWVVIN